MFRRLAVGSCLVSIAILSILATPPDEVRPEKKIRVTNEMAGLKDVSFTAAVWALAFSPEQQRLAAGVRYGQKGDKPPYYAKSYILIFDLRSPERGVRKIELSAPPATSVYPELFWSADGRYVATAFYGDWNHAAIADLKTGALHAFSTRDCRVKGVLAGPQVALSCFNGEVMLLTPDSSETRELGGDSRAAILSVDSKSGQIAVLMSPRRNTALQHWREIAIFNAADWKEVRRWSLPPGEVGYSATFVKGGTALCALEEPIATSNRALTCWDIPSGAGFLQRLLDKGFTGPLMGADSSIGMRRQNVKNVPKPLRRLAETDFVFSEPKISIFDLRSGQQIAELPTGWLPVWGMSGSGDSFAYSAAGAITIYRLKEQSPHERSVSGKEQ